MTRIAVIVPAAGSSSRLGRPKLLLCDPGGRTLIERQVQLAQTLDPVQIVIVTGAEHASIASALAPSGARIVHNPRWTDGLGQSIACGAAEITPQAMGVLVLLGDQWQLVPEDLGMLTAAWRAAPDRIVASRYGRSMGVPALFPRRWLPELRQLSGAVGAQRVLSAARPAPVVLDLPRAANDLDTAADVADSPWR